MFRSLTDIILMKYLLLLDETKKVSDKPSIIIAHTHKGQGRFHFIGRTMLDGMARHLTRSRQSRQLKNLEVSGNGK